MCTRQQCFRGATHICDAKSGRLCVVRISQVLRTGDDFVGAASISQVLCTRDDFVGTAIYWS